MGRDVCKDIDISFLGSTSFLLTVFSPTVQNPDIDGSCCCRVPCQQGYVIAASPKMFPFSLCPFFSELLCQEVLMSYNDICYGHVQKLTEMEFNSTKAKAVCSANIQELCE